MAINPAIGSIAGAIQRGRDTAATEPTFKHGLTGGSPFSAGRTISNTPVACGNRAPSDAYVDSVEVGASVEALCYPTSLGYYLYAGLGKVVSTAMTGATGYYKHVFTMGDTLPYLTIWSQVGVDNFTKVIGSKASSVAIAASGNAPLTLNAEFVGIDGEVGIDAIPGTLNADCYGGKFIPTDCTIKLDTAGTTPAEEIVTDFSFIIANGTSGLSSIGRVTPRDIADGNLSVGVSVTTIPDNIEPYQKLVTSSKTSTKITSKIVMGTVYAKFVHSDDPTITLEIEVAHVPFTADYPSVDPKGTEGTIQFTCDAALITAAGESPAKVTLVNKQAAYALGDGAITASTKSAKSTK